MLACTVRIVQVLDLLEVRTVITRFSPGEDPEQFASQAVTFQLTDDLSAQDDLTIIKTILGLWSEMTNRT